jgi:Flp pilus assembly pilin Flp
MDRWTASEAGQGLVEYAMILVLAVLALVAALTALGGSIEDVLYTPIVDAFISFFS